MSETQTTEKDPFHSLRKEIRSLYGKLLLRDRARVAHRIRELDRFTEKELTEFHHLLTNLAAHNLEHLRRNFTLKIPETLPIFQRKEEIASAVKDNNVVIVCGATGSGKTTQLPKIALSLGLGKFGRIGCTQPRRIAAMTLAQRLAAETETSYGSEVGCKVRFDDRTDRKTVVKFMTDGILLAETRNDPRLLEYECLILDEVHERSLNIDFLLGYVKRLLEKRRNLKIIISSATLEAEKISAFFNNAPVIEVEGTLYPIEDHYLAPLEEEELDQCVARGVDYLYSLGRGEGDILVFLPGEREIRDCMEVLEGRKYSRTQILPLFGRLSAADQQKVFHSSSFRRIILATNVAETSVTIPNIRFVIDPSLVRLSRYNPRSRIQELQIEPVSKASARQRRGRCGRLQDGICVHLCSEEQYEGFDEYTDPEIRRSSLAGVLLQMASLNLGPIEEFPLMDPPPEALIREGRQMLTDLLAFDAQGRITPDGRKMAQMVLDPHLAKMLLASLWYKVLPEMVVIASYLSIPDPRERPLEEAAKADQAHRMYSNVDSDFLGILVLYDAIRKLPSHQALRNFAKKNYYNYRRLREWMSLIHDLQEICKENNWNCEGKIDPEHLSADAIHKTILCALPRHLGCFNPENNLFSEMKGKKFTIFPGSAVAKRKKTPPWLLYSALVETSRVFARINAVVEPAFLEEVAPHVCTKSYDLAKWDEASGFVYAREKVMAGQLLIHPGRRCHYAKTHPAEARSIFIREGLATGLARLKGSWLDHFNTLLEMLRSLEVKTRKVDGILDTEGVIAHLEKVLPPHICSLQSLKADFQRNHKDYSPEMEEILLTDLEEIHEEEYPDTLRASGVDFKLRYVYDPGEENDGITLEVPEEMLNLLNPYRMEYLVGGFLREKVGFMLRSMNKTYRKLFMPLDEVAEAFTEAFLEGEICTGQSLAAALCAFLKEFRGEAPEISVFKEMELPEYLIMKLAVRGKNGKAVIHRTFPKEHFRDSKLSHALPGVKKFRSVSSGDHWPGEEVLPEETPFSGNNPVMAYPALTLERDSAIGTELFLDPAQAKTHHREALIHLWKQSLPQMVKTLSNALKVNSKINLEFFLEYPSWKEDVTDLAIERALGSDLWQIRSAEEFSRKMEESRDTVLEEALSFLNTLEKLFPLLQEVQSLLRRFREDSPVREDVEMELSTYFRSGFFRTPELFEQTFRYLKGLSLRLRRAIDSPGKDLSKGEYLQSFIRKCRLAEEAVGGLEHSRGLQEFHLLLQECRLAVYAPEIRPVCRCSEKILLQAWQEMKLR